MLGLQPARPEVPHMYPSPWSVGIPSIQSAGYVEEPGPRDTKAFLASHLWKDGESKHCADVQGSWDITGAVLVGP